MHRVRIASIMAIALALALPGCRPAEPAPPPATEPVAAPAQPASAPIATTPVTTDPTPRRAPTVAFRVYFDYQEKVQPVYRAVPYTRGVIKAAVTELIKGPSASERSAGLTCQVPQSTKLRGVSLRRGIATIDLSGAFDDGGGTFSETMRLAELVYTATQFNGVTGVVLKMDGRTVEVFSPEGIELGPEPLKRGDYEDYAPAILVESPAWGATLQDPARLSGSSNVFEARHTVQIVAPGGQTVSVEEVTASSGSGTRGTWSATTPYTIPSPGWGKVSVFSRSAKDGSAENVLSVPVYLAR